MNVLCRLSIIFFHSEIHLLYNFFEFFNTSPLQSVIQIYESEIIKIALFFQMRIFTNLLNFNRFERKSFIVNNILMSKMIQYTRRSVNLISCIKNLLKFFYQKFAEILLPKICGNFVFNCEFNDKVYRRRPVKCQMFCISFISSVQ